MLYRLLVTSPTTHSLAEMRKRGYICQVVERWNQYACVRQDLFGFIDILAIRNGEIVGIQTTTATNVSARKRKAIESKYLSKWLLAGGKFILHGWKKPTKTCRTWVLAEEEIIGN